MVSTRATLRDVHGALDAATTYDQWLAAAREHDRLTGAEDWRAEDASAHYDATAVRAAVDRWRRLRAAGDPIALAEALTEDFYRHQNELAASELYEVALGGTKHLVETFLAEGEASLEWLVDAEAPGLDDAAKLQRFEIAYKVFGRSALLLSGGATLGFHHLGVVKALFEQGLLPHILSGSSTGAMIAAGVCARDDAELAAMYADPSVIRLDGLAPVGLARAVGQGAWLDPEHLYEVLHHNIGGRTFAEAFAHSGRALNIAVSPTRSRQKPRLLSHLTAPDVLVARAALASSALPGLFPPVELLARGPDGGVVPHSPGERWVDGSLYEDLPKLRLARLHNVNHFIVSQTNPHVLPFVRHYGRRGLRSTLAGIAGSALRTQGTWAADLLRRVNRRGRGPVGQAIDRAYALVSQDYGGDIDIHPQFQWRLYRKVVSNPTREDLAGFIREGERSVWPQVAIIRNQTRIGWAFRRCIGRLQERAG